MTNVESGIREMLDLVNSQRAELATLRDEVEKWKVYGECKERQLRIEQSIGLSLGGDVEDLRAENETLQKKNDALIIAIGMINGIAKEALK